MNTPNSNCTKYAPLSSGGWPCMHSTPLSPLVGSLVHRIWQFGLIAMPPSLPFSPPALPFCPFAASRSRAPTRTLLWASLAPARRCRRPSRRPARRGPHAFWRGLLRTRFFKWPPPAPLAVLLSNRLSTARCAPRLPRTRFPHSPFGMFLAPRLPRFAYEGADKAPVSNQPIILNFTNK